MSALKLFSGIGNSYRILSDVPFWFSEMQYRSQIEKEFADKAERWLKNVSEKLYIMGEQNVDGLIQIESALQMEVQKMEERTRAAIVYSSAYEVAANLLLSERETTDEKLILSKYETSFQETLKPYKYFFNRVEEGRKAYERSMNRLEKLVMDDAAFWFKKKKVKTARKTAKRYSDKYIQLIKENTNQAINIHSLSKEYERVATEIADKKVKSFVSCWSSCMSRLAENFTGEIRNMFKQGELLFNKVDSEMLIRQLSELNKESLNTPVYQEFQGTLDVEKLLGYRPVVATVILGLSADEHGETKNVVEENNQINLADSSMLYDPFSSTEAVYGEENKEEDNNLLTPVDSNGEPKLSRCVKAVVITKHKKKECLEMNIKPGDKVEQLTPPNSMGMVYVRKMSRVTRMKTGGFIPFNCILPI